MKILLTNINTVTTSSSSSNNGNTHPHSIVNSFVFKPTSTFRSLMINAAKQISTAKFESGYIGALSPTPKSFIDLILKDDLFCNHGSEICDDTNDYGVTFHSKSGEIDKLNNDYDVVDYDYKNSRMESPLNTKQKESIPTEKISATIDYQKLDFTSVKSVVDIGSGDGRWLTAFYDRFHCLCFGIEMDKDRLEFCRKNLDIQYSYNDDDTNCCNALREKKNRNEKARNDKIELILGDFRTFNCSGISVVIVYLSRVGNDIIKDKLEKECCKGTLVIVVGVSKLPFFHFFIFYFCLLLNRIFLFFINFHYSLYIKFQMKSWNCIKKFRNGSEKTALSVYLYIL